MVGVDVFEEKFALYGSVESFQKVKNELIYLK